MTHKKLGMWALGLKFQDARPPFTGELNSTLSKPWNALPTVFFSVICTTSCSLTRSSTATFTTGGFTSLFKIDGIAMQLNSLECLLGSSWNFTLKPNISIFFGLTPVDSFLFTRCEHGLLYFQACVRQQFMRRDLRAFSLDRASFVLQQGGDVDVPADGLPVEAAGEQVARLVLLVPRRATHHAPVALHRHTYLSFAFSRRSPTQKLPFASRTILLLRGSRASRTPLMSNRRTCRLSCGRAMILWLAETLILQYFSWTLCDCCVKPFLHRFYW